MDTQPKEANKDIYKETTEEIVKDNSSEGPSISPPPHQASTDQADIEALKDSYDDFLYVSKAFASCSINSLIATARIYGLDPAPIKGARVLELGSSCGGNIIHKRCTIQRQLSQASTCHLYKSNTVTN